MKQKIIIVFLLIFGGVLFAQDGEEKPKEGWIKKGEFSLLFNQSSFKNWVAGGEDNIAGNVGINYDFNYKKGKNTWDNKIIASYGLTKSQTSDFIKKTDDRLEFNSVFGRNAKNKWYYSMFYNFKTQFTKGYKYGKDDNGKEIRTDYTDLFSPANMSFGLGMLWKKNDNFKINLAPITGRITIVDKDRTLPDAAYFGVDEGKSSRIDLGFNASIYAKFDLMKNVSIENTLNFYSNYLDSILEIDTDYTANVVFKVNKYLSANLIVQMLYDLDAYKGLQVREVLGLSFNLGF